MNDTVARQRLHNQRLSRAGHRDPARVVSWFGAVQAQEYGPAKWGLGRRMPPGVTDARIQRAFDAGRILRTHVMRPTWHFVTPADIRWMLELTAPQVRRRMATYDRQLGLSSRIFLRAASVCERVLRDDQFLTRDELGAHLQRAGLPGKGIPLAHIALQVELEGVICSGPRKGKQSTYALVGERAPRARRLTRDEALAELARRYFRSHGPATARDFAWWSGLSAADARRALEASGVRPVELEEERYWTTGPAATGAPRSHRAHLLPIYDEYLIAYRDRKAVPHGPSMVPSRAGGYVRFQHPLVVAGQVAGTWRPTQRPGHVEVTAALLRRLTEAERRALQAEVERYGRFLGVPASLTPTP